MKKTVAAILATMCLFSMANAQPSNQIDTAKPPVVSKPQTYMNADLTGRNFAGASLVGSKFINVTLNRANFAGADLRNAEFVNVDLEKADLRGANFEGATMINVDTDGALLNGAIWTHGKVCATDC